MNSKFVVTCFTLFGVMLGWLLHSLWAQYFHQDVPGFEDFSRSYTGSSAVQQKNERSFWREQSDKAKGERSGIEGLTIDSVNVGNPGDQATEVTFDRLMSEVSDLEVEASYVAATEVLMGAALKVANEKQRLGFETTLARIVDKAARKLISQERYGLLDQLYERIALELPELAEYYLKLARLRIRMGNESGAFQPLAQIQNHSIYGAQARKLLLQLEESQIVAANFVDEIPLTVRGGQYAVEAIIDPDQTGRGTSIRLLVDTGAAMTAIDVGVLSSLGYDLDERSEYFATANGVVEAPVVTLGALALGESTVSKISIGALNLDSQTRIDGLLGMNFLRHFEFRLNQQDQILELQRREDE